MEKRNCALLKTKLDINIKTKFRYCLQYSVKQCIFHQTIRQTNNIQRHLISLGRYFEQHKSILDINKVSSVCIHHLY